MKVPLGCFGLVATVAPSTATRVGEAVAPVSPTSTYPVCRPAGRARRSTRDELCHRWSRSRGSPPRSLADGAAPTQPWPAGADQADSGVSAS